MHLGQHLSCGFFFPFKYNLSGFFVKCVSLLLPKFTVTQHEILRAGAFGHCQEPGVWALATPQVTSMCMDMILQEIPGICHDCAYFSGQ